MLGGANDFVVESNIVACPPRAPWRLRPYAPGQTPHAVAPVAGLEAGHDRAQPGGRLAPQPVMPAQPILPKSQHRCKGRRRRALRRQRRMSRQVSRLRTRRLSRTACSRRRNRADRICRRGSRGGGSRGSSPTGLTRTRRITPDSASRGTAATAKTRPVRLCPTERTETRWTGKRQTGDRRDVASATGAPQFPPRSRATPVAPPTPSPYPPRRTSETTQPEADVTAGLAAALATGGGAAAAAAARSGSGEVTQQPRYPRRSHRRRLQDLRKPQVRLPICSRRCFRIWNGSSKPHSSVRPRPSRFRKRLRNQMCKRLRKHRPSRRVWTGGARACHIRAGRDRHAPGGTQPGAEAGRATHAHVRARHDSATEHGTGLFRSGCR